jgi:hypothetical protein
MFKLRGEKSFIDRVAIDFVANSAPREVERVNEVLNNGDSTRWIDLNGARRCIDKIYVTGNSEGSRAPSQVDVIGYRDDRYVPPRHEMRLGDAMLSEGRQIDYVNVRNACGLSQVKIQVRGDSAQIGFLAVRFVGTGNFQQIPIRQSFKKNSESAWKNLNGNRRCIDSFYVVGRSSSRPHDARVRLIGR